MTAEKKELVVPKDRKEVVRVGRFESFTEGLYWVEFAGFWISFSSRGKKLAFLLEMRSH